jgi:hypothetical protein
VRQGLFAETLYFGEEIRQVANKDITLHETGQTRRLSLSVVIFNGNLTAILWPINVSALRWEHKEMSRCETTISYSAV